MENKPTLEEVKEYFKNAELLKIVQTEFKRKGKIYLLYGNYYQKHGNWCLWSSENGYTEILTCKEKTFTISESQVIELIEVTGFESKINNKLKVLFPEIFENKVKLEVGKWYKSLDHPKWMFCVAEIIEKSKIVKGYGFGPDGLWMENISDETWEFYEFDRCIEVSESEVFEALKNEAVKRGLGDGVYYLSALNKTPHCHHLHFDDLYFHYKSNYLSDGHGSEIFQDGKWAEPIEAIIKSEAERQLNKKIID